jgi:hypothetical protein
LEKTLVPLADDAPNSVAAPALRLRQSGRDGVAAELIARVARHAGPR